MRSISECETRCQDNQSCQAFTFNLEQKRCFLKSSYEFAQRVSGSTAGLYCKAAPTEENKSLPVKWEVFLNQNLTNADSTPYPGVRNYRDCMSACESTEGCGGFTWVYHSNADVCYIVGVDAASGSVERSGKGSRLRPESKRDGVTRFRRTSSAEGLSRWCLRKEPQT